MRLLVSCIPFDGGKSGLSVYAREVVRALRAQGHKLTLIFEPDVDLASFGLKVQRFEGSKVPGLNLEPGTASEASLRQPSGARRDGRGARWRR